MLNKEKYAEEIINIAVGHGQLAIVNGEPARYWGGNCQDCIGYNGGAMRDEHRCEEKVRKWAYGEYVDPPVDWENVKVDTPILVKHPGDKVWSRRYFAGYKRGMVYTWLDGTTSWSVGGDFFKFMELWECAKLVESEK